VIYPLAGLLFVGVLLFLCRLGSRRQIRWLLQTPLADQKFRELFGVGSVPHGDTVDDACAKVAVDDVQAVVSGLVRTLFRRSFDSSWSKPCSVCVSAANVAKHRVSFAEATTVFRDPRMVSLVDEAHGADEERWITIGTSAAGRMDHLDPADDEVFAFVDAIARKRKTDPATVVNALLRADKLVADAVR